MKKIRNKDLSNIISTSVVVLLAALIFVLLFIFSDANLFHYTAEMDSDIASETLLTTVLYQNGHVQPRTWYMSSTPRVISVPNLASFIYPLFSYNANLSTGIACVIMMLILIAVMYLFYRQIGFSVIQTLISLIVVMTFTNASDECQRMLFLYASFYVSHIITMFLIFIFYNKWLKDNKLAIWTLILSLGIAVLNGMQGMHGCMFCYVPLVGTECIRRLVYLIKGKKQNNIFILIWIIILFGCSFGIAKSLNTTNIGASRNIRNGFSKLLFEVLPALAKVLSFNRLTIIAVIILLLSIAGYGYYLFNIVKYAGRIFDEDTFYNYKAALPDDKSDLRYHIYQFWSPAVLLLGFVLSIFLEAFTTSEVAGRYFILMLFVVATGVSLFVQVFIEKVYGLIGVAVIVMIYGVFSGISFYGELIKGDVSEISDEYMVYQWMKDNGYSYGYSTFDYGNTLTVMSNDAVKVRAVNNMKDMEGCKWLSDTTWYPPVKSDEGATCYILTEDIWGDFSAFLETYKPEVIEIAETGVFTIYVLDHDYTLWER
ncbi:hypothetical protein [Butyrivibrio sp.]|uniref:hypothetical protein n=1 Tax=Butyrivibrio sp. TaxID=28121 RepID=UPI0025C36C9A|nr:hypothetical protein [Butyrivibrio sp.]MBQ9305771.1 hypothetical protein [Butyrivibrio sp.]